MIRGRMLKMKSLKKSTMVESRVVEKETVKHKGVDILNFFMQSTYWQRTEGRDHVIPMHHPNAFRFLREEANASILVVANFGRYSKEGVVHAKPAFPDVPKSEIPVLTKPEVPELPKSTLPELPKTIILEISKPILPAMNTWINSEYTPIINSF
ncbi:probable arabinosyltransferase ARAD1 [Tanacetum coccineum]